MWSSDKGGIDCSHKNATFIQADGLNWNTLWIKNDSYPKTIHPTNNSATLEAELESDFISIDDWLFYFSQILVDALDVFFKLFLVNTIAIVYFMLHFLYPIKQIKYKHSKGCYNPKEVLWYDYM